MFLLIFISIFFHIDLFTSEPNDNTITTVTTTTVINPYRAHDYIVNPHNFSFIQNPGYSVCGDDTTPIYILIYVHSAPEHYKRRSIIRETWTTRTLFPDLRLVFMMGKTHDKDVMNAIEYENEIYHDIVQEDFYDAYKNLSYKGIMALKWISIYCSKTQYILKVDDDIVANTFTLINHFKHIDRDQSNKQNRIFCLVWTTMHPERDVQSKWYLSKKDFPLDVFPTYCSGSAFVLTGDLAGKMYNASLYVPFFWVDDYYITGAVASAVNVNYTQLGSLYTIPEGLARERFMSPSSFYKIMFGHFPGSMNNMRACWHRILLMQKHRFPNLIETLSFNWDKTIYENSFQ